MIEFRGEESYSGEVVFGHYACVDGQHVMITDKDSWTSHDEYHDLCINEVTGIKPSSLAMFTGKLDKNGTKIFGSVEVDGEMSKGGDDVRVDKSKWPAFSNSEVIASVTWQSLCCSFSCRESTVPPHPNGNILSDLGAYSSNQLEVIPKGDKS